MNSLWPGIFPRSRDLSCTAQIIPEKQVACDVTGTSKPGLVWLEIGEYSHRKRTYSPYSKCPWFLNLYFSHLTGPWPMKTISRCFPQGTRAGLRRRKEPQPLISMIISTARIHQADLLLPVPSMLLDFLPQLTVMVTSQMHVRTSSLTAARSGRPWKQGPRYHTHFSGKCLQVWSYTCRLVYFAGVE